MTEAEFVAQLTTDQPFVSKYFSYAVELNRKGAPDMKAALDAVPVGEEPAQLSDDDYRSEFVIVDARHETDFKAGHPRNAINIQDGTKFETWLGSIIALGEPFYLAAQDKDSLKRLIERCAGIGYEPFIR